MVVPLFADMAETGLGEEKLLFAMFGTFLGVEDDGAWKCVVAVHVMDFDL